MSAAEPDFHWEIIAGAALFLDVVGLIGCIWMFACIIAYESYHTTKDRIILMLCIVTILFVMLGNTPEKIHILSDGFDSPIPEWNLFFVYATWWMVLMSEAILLIYSLYIIVSISPGASLRTSMITIKFELAVVILVIIVGAVGGGLSVYSLGQHCSDGKGDIYLDGQSSDCNSSIATITWIWIGFLSVPCAVQFAIWCKVVAASRKIEAHHEQTRNGQLVQDPSLTVAPALERVIKLVVRPLQWYPIVFLLVAALYVVWVVSLYSAERTKSWARKVGPASSLVFAVKGVTIFGVFLVNRDYSRIHRGLFAQIRFRLITETSRNSKASGLNDSLVQEFSSQGDGLTSSSFQLSYDDDYAANRPLSETVTSTTSLHIHG